MDQRKSAVGAQRLTMERPVKLARSTILFLGLATMLSTSGCVVRSNECSWAASIWPDAGFETRWTIGEKRQVVAHNEKVEALCD